MVCVIVSEWCHSGGGKRGERKRKETEGNGREGKGREGKGRVGKVRVEYVTRKKSRSQWNMSLFTQKYDENKRRVIYLLSALSASLLRTLLSSLPTSSYARGSSCVS